MDYKEILEEIHEEIIQYKGKGKVADYIPMLAEVDPNQFGMSVQLFDGTNINVGDYDTLFSVQSISKIFSLTLALGVWNDRVFERVGKEPSGEPFNSLVLLEYEKGLPRNPFINAGAIVVTDSLITFYKDEFKALSSTMNLVKKIGDNQSLTFNPDIARSELSCGFRNEALASLMKSFGNLDNDIQTVLNTYYKHCAIEMSTKELARAAAYLANHGKDPLTEEEVTTPLQAKRINSLMLTCGLYDASGDFAFDVGLPSKSGVGGGIVSVVPGHMSIAVWSPALNEKGNSFIGTEALKLFVKKTGLSIF